MKLIIIVIITLLSLIGLILLLKCIKCNVMLKKEFSEHSVIVFGAKGKGKDLLFQKVIVLNKKKDYLSNIDYGYKYIHKDINDLTVKPNTYKHFISGKITEIKKIDLLEGKDMFISDAGIYLPCQYDFDLNRLYPSFPIFYAISRHLYNMNIHMNTQNIERPWKIIREQADSFILCKGKIKLFFGILVRIRKYEKYSSAVDRLIPIKSRFLNKLSKAEVDVYNAKNGEIKDYIFYIRKKSIKYDTRHFHKVLFGYAANNKKKNK